MPGVLERRWEDVDLLWWRGWRFPWGSGSGGGGGWGWRTGTGGEGSGRGRWTWGGGGALGGVRRSGSGGGGSWGWLMGTGSGGNGEPGGGVWGEGEVDVGRRWRAWLRRGEREWWWRGLGMGVLYGR